MTSFIRKLIIGGSAAALAAVAGIPAFASAVPPRMDASPAPAEVAPPPTVEDFAYPGAVKVQADRKIRLIRGDGNIMLADSCDNSPEQIKVWSRVDPERPFCFRATAKAGYLAMEIAEVWGLETADHPLSADLTSDGGRTHRNVDVDRGKYKSVGEGTGGDPTMLVEIRVTG
ncbi:hypothetical protein ACFWXK_27410 [Streptomyces sp. NPDC059070]|uniref:hypothetical protein n=1 Tax=Streptomyces sp. NPDC059070 TaxID=3346713 RepID=UPI00368559C1